MEPINLSNVKTINVNSVDVISIKDKDNNTLWHKSNKYTIQLTTNNNTGSTALGTTLSSSIVWENEDTTIRAIPGQGCSFVGWSDGNTNNPRTITSVKSNINLKAYFSLNIGYYFIGRSNNNTFGTVYPTIPYALNGEGYAIFTATPKSGYKFKRWETKSGTIYSTSTTIQVPASDYETGLTLIAIFETNN